jgi:hypothetical protein
MPVRKKLLLATAAVAALAVPTAAIGQVFETGGNPANLASACPNDCIVLAKVTGYQTKVGTTPGAMVAAKSGRIVAWTVTLGNPTAKQLAYFQTENNLGEASANFTVLRPKKKLRYTAVQQGPSTVFTKYFGSTVTIPLTRTISVKKGDVIGITTKSWLPVMAVNQPSSTSWRASRGKGKCEDTGPNGKDYSQTKLKRTVQYACLYRGVQLLYSVTIVPNPPAVKKK